MSTGTTIGIQEGPSALEFGCLYAICELPLGDPPKIILPRTEENPSGCGRRLLRCPTRPRQCALEKLHKLCWSPPSTLSTSSKAKQARRVWMTAILIPVSDHSCVIHSFCACLYLFLLPSMISEIPYDLGSIRFSPY